MSERKKSRYHVTRTSSTKYLLNADSQARYLDAGNLNIVSLPGASVRHAYDYVPPAGLFDIIILFIGGNDLYNFTEPSLTPDRKVADDIVELANFLCNRAPSVFVLGVPERDENKTRSKAVNDLLQDIAERKPKKPCKVEWNYRSVKQTTLNRCTVLQQEGPPSLIRRWSKQPAQSRQGEGVIQEVQQRVQLPSKLEEIRVSHERLSGYLQHLVK